MTESAVRKMVSIETVQYENGINIQYAIDSDGLLWWRGDDDLCQDWTLGDQLPGSAGCATRAQMDEVLNQLGKANAAHGAAMSRLALAEKIESRLRGELRAQAEARLADRIAWNLYADGLLAKIKDLEAAIERRALEYRNALAAIVLTGPPRAQVSESLQS